jgi:hypothetical protein
MNTYKSLINSKYDCKYRGVFVPKGRKKTLFAKSESRSWAGSMKRFVLYS